MLCKSLVLLTSLAIAHAAEDGIIKLPLKRRQADRSSPLHHRIKRADAALSRRHQPPSKLNKRHHVVSVPITGAFELTDDNVIDTGPLVEVEIGGQPVLLSPATGNYQLTVLAPGSVSGSHLYFDPTLSPTWVQTNSTPQVVSLGAQSTTSLQGADTVTLLGTDFSFPNTSIAVTTNSTLSGQSGFDGSLGLYPANQIVKGQPNFLDQLIASNLLAQPLFAFSPPTRARDNPFVAANLALSRSSGSQPNASLFDANHGTLTFGGYDQEAFDGELEWAPLVSDQDWQVQLDAISINGAAVANTSSVVAAIDSGSSGIILPTDIANAVADAMGGKMVSFNDVDGSNVLGGGFPWLSAPCNASYTFAFTIGGKDLVVDLQDLFFDILDRDAQVCILNVASTDTPYAILGASFLANVYSVFSLPNGKPDKIAFGQARGTNTEPTRLADLAARYKHTGLLAVDGRAPDAVNGDAPVPSSSAPASKMRMIKRRR